MRKILLLISIFCVAAVAGATTYHTVSFTGTPSSDFAPNEKVSTSSGGVTAYLTWDANNLYIGYDANNSEPVVIYIDTDPSYTPTSGTGTASGFNYDGVTPTLPFTANFVAYMKNGYNEYRTASGASWSSNTANTISTWFGTNTEEYSIPWSDMGGKPSNIYFLLYKDNGGNYIYGQAPGQVGDGNNSSPSFGNYYSDVVTSGISPFGFSDSPLAVEMSSYSATFALNAVTLYWKTQSELDNAGFEISRKTSADANYTTIASYKSVASLRGLGTSTEGKSYSFVDDKVIAGTTYDYKIVDLSVSGTSKEYGPIRVQAVSEVPDKYALNQNYPNPFNPTTTITADLKQGSNVRVDIYNSLGMEIQNLFNGYKPAGTQSFVWDATRFPSGIYFYRLTTDQFTSIRKMTLLK